MLTTNGSPQRARWAVMWVYVNKQNKRKLYRKNFGDDYASAEALYLKAVKAKKPYATLACVNMGFPPPVDLRTRTVRKKGRDRRTKKIRVVEVELNPLKEMNLQGKLWCPYCRVVREFILSKHATVYNVHFSDPRYVCPICKVSHRDHSVREWNPTACLHMESAVSARRASRRSSGRPIRRRRTTRA